MDQNTKRDRAQKLKRDKKSKDIKRAHDHPSLSAPKPGCVIAPQVVLTSAKRNDFAVGKTTTPKETVDNANDATQFANLKRETDQISAINKSFSKRQITSNWLKYETPLPLDDDDSCTSKGADFESLLGAPISEGGHFKFKSERMWAPNSLQYSNFFSLNVKCLVKSLSCIPFYDQVNLPRELFSPEEIQQMDYEVKLHSDGLKTCPKEPLVDTFYEILKSSLVVTPANNSVDVKLDCVDHGVKSTLLESGGIEFYANDRVPKVQPKQCSQPIEDPNSLSIRDKVNTSSSTTEEKRVPSDGDVAITPTPLVSLPQRSSQSKPTDSTTEEKRVPSDGDVAITPTPLVSLPQRSPQSKQPARNNQPSKASVIPEEIALREISQSCDSKDAHISTTFDKDDELDFLLTLGQPVGGPTFAGKLASNSSDVPVVDDLLDDDLAVSSLLSNAEKREDLEDWLDSILDD